MRLNVFGTQFISVVAATMLLAACESTPENTGANSGAGNASAGSQTATTGVQAPRPGSAEDFQVNVGDRVFFDYDQYALKADARSTLDRQVAWLKQYPQKTVVIEGHADERGTREYNLALGDRRANSAKRYLESQGIAAARIKTISYGKERPAVLGSNEAAWSQNRRAVTVISN